MSVNVVSINKQHGYSMVLFFLVIFLGSVAVILPNINHDRIRLRNDQINNENLQKAKEALLNFAANSFRITTAAGVNLINRYGVLPCPDASGTVNVEGAEDPNCGNANANTLGRLPWRRLGIEDFRDINNECLWYAVSGTYKNNPPSGFLNSDTPGTLQISDENGNLIANDVVAIIIAPGISRAGQNRAVLAPPETINVCGGNYTAANYLDSANGLNNADVTPVVAPALGAIDNFYVNSTLNTATENIALGNDELVYITRQELWAHLAKNNQLTLDIANRILFGQSEQAGGAQTGLWACIKSSIENQAPTPNTIPDRQFPFPALVGLPDYTSNGSYIPDPTVAYAAPPFRPLLNRLPDFRNIALLNPSCAPVWTDAESLNLYNNWKDHFFIALSQAADTRTNDFVCIPPNIIGCQEVPVGSGIFYDVPDCVNSNCLAVNDAIGATPLPLPANNYAVIIFSGFSQNGNIRTGNPVQWPFPFLAGDTKSQLGNYLEGNALGTNNLPANVTTNGSYTLQQTVPVTVPRTPPLNSSDILYCITMTTDTHILNIQLCP